MPLKRPYRLGKRRAQSDRKRTAILGAARKQLASMGYLELTMDGMARASRVTRQTVHNLFGTKSDLLEALFDQLAHESGMEGMRRVMQEPDPVRMVSAFAEIFSGFWSKDRLLLRRIHGIAAIDPEFASALTARSQRRWAAATRVIGRLRQTDKGIEHDVAKLYALTSFEFFDVLADVSGENIAAEIVMQTVRSQFTPEG